MLNLIGGENVTPELVFSVMADDASRYRGLIGSPLYKRLTKLIGTAAINSAAQEMDMGLGLAHQWFVPLVGPFDISFSQEECENLLEVEFPEGPWEGLVQHIRSGSDPNKSLMYNALLKIYNVISRAAIGTESYSAERAKTSLNTVLDILFCFGIAMEELDVDNSANIKNMRSKLFVHWFYRASGRRAVYFDQPDDALRGYGRSLTSISDGDSIKRELEEIARCGYSTARTVMRRLNI